MNDLYRVREAADVLRFSPGTMYRIIRAGLIPVVNLGEKSMRIRKQDLERFVEDRIVHTVRHVNEFKVDMKVEYK